jgi:hypothetical protein
MRIVKAASGTGVLGWCATKESTHWGCDVEDQIESVSEEERRPQFAVGCSTLSTVSA